VTRSVALAAGIAAIALTAPATASAACVQGDVTASSLSSPDQHAALLCAINAERAARGMPGVVAGDQLARAAQRDADDMVTRRYFAHVTPEGTTLAERVRATGWMSNASDWSLGEAIGWAQEPLDTTARIVQAWLDSTPHRQILLDPTFNEVGIGVAPGVPLAPGGGATYVLDFGIRKVRPWRSPTTCASEARRSPRTPARCGSISTRSRPSTRGQHRTSTHGATTWKARLMTSRLTS
jgi:uncharacterized protein YkwD